MKENSKPQKKRPRTSNVTGLPSVRRKSARLAASAHATRTQDHQNNMSSDPIDLLSMSRLSESPTRVRHEIRLRKLSPPRMPSVEETGEDELVSGATHKAAIPTRDKMGTLHFENEPYFMPNLTPEEIIRAGSFGGTTFR